jgi:predicted amidohydrolase
MASQAGAYVIMAAGLIDPEDVPAPYRDWAYRNTGDSCIIDPRGEVIAGPAQDETILVADASLDLVLAAKMACDVGGHYGRKDVFDLRVRRDDSDPAKGRPQR